MTTLRIRWFACLALVGCQLLHAQTQEGQKSTPSFKRIQIRVPMAEAGEAGLETVLIVPWTPGRHPLLLMTHGSDSSKSTNRAMGPGIMQPEAIWFARRGWVVAIVTRRGYGSSGGKMDKTHYGCDEDSFAKIADEDAADLTAVYNAVRNMSFVDGDNVAATGNSAGGFAALSFGAHAPPALKAVVNFSGGWHSLFFAGSCAKSGLIPEFHNLGAAIHVPTLWLYAKNDSLFPPKSVASMYKAFTSAGGEVELPVIGKSGTDGHYLFSESVETWAPLVESFLARHGLPSKDLAPDVGENLVKLPPGYPGDMQDAFLKWQKLGPNKAFAIGPNGAWSYSSGRKTLKIAKEEALDRCRSQGCKIVAWDGQ